MACPTCGGEQKPWLKMPLDAKKLTPTPYRDALRCVSCGLGVIDPLPDASEVPDFYRLDAYYTHGQSHIAGGDPVSLLDRARINLAWRFDRGEQQTPEKILARLGRPAGKDVAVCDIGAGHGDTPRAFAALGCKAAAVDPDPEAVAYMQAQGVEARLGTGETAAEAFSAEMFDIVIASHSLEHCIDPLKALRSMHQILKPGGVLLVETPNCACLHFKRFNVVSEMYDAPRHLYFFTPKSLALMLETAGFREPQAYYHGFTRHHENNWRAVENRIRSALLKSGAAEEEVPPGHSRGESWSLLLATLFADKARKYDCVGFYATK